MSASKSEVRLEVGGREVRVTSPDKVVFPEPGITKLEQSAKAARRSVPSTKAQSLVSRSMKGSTAGKFKSGGGK